MLEILTRLLFSLLLTKLLMRNSRHVTGYPSFLYKYWVFFFFTPSSILISGELIVWNVHLNWLELKPFNGPVSFFFSRRKFRPDHFYGNSDFYVFVVVGAVRLTVFLFFFLFFNSRIHTNRTSNSNTHARNVRFPRPFPGDQHVNDVFLRYNKITAWTVF